MHNNYNTDIIKEMVWLKSILIIQVGVSQTPTVCTMHDIVFFFVVVWRLLINWLHIHYQTDSNSTFFPQTAEIWVHLTDGGVPPVVGRNYTLVCNVSSAETLDDIYINKSYHWMKNNATLVQAVHTDTLSLSPFRLSYTGQYVCEVTVHFNETTLRHTDTYNVIYES